MDEKRDRMRQPLAKLAFAKNDESTRGGLLRDISAGGAGLRFVNPLGTADHLFQVGDTVEVIIDGFQELTGEVVRTKTEDIFVSFDLKGKDEETLIADIMIAANNLPEDVHHTT